jgi:hypothetical protein
MNELPVRPLRFQLARAVYDICCAFAMLIGATTGLLLYLEYGQLTTASRVVLALPPLLVGAGLAARYRRKRRR